MAGFPSGESVQTGGWDGIVHATTGNAYVPDGWSGWELSKRGDTKANADEDYEKRTADPEHLDRTKTVFVFVTPRRFPNTFFGQAEDEAPADRSLRGAMSTASSMLRHMVSARASAV
jgi:hypothetical protein